MASPIAIRPYRGADEAALLELWNDALARVLRSRALMRGGVSSSRYLDYYDALRTVRGCLGGFAKAVAVMLPPGGCSHDPCYQT